MRRAIEEADAALNNYFSRNTFIPLGMNWWSAECSEIHGLDDERRGIVCEVCGYGAKRPKRSWPQRHYPQAARYFPADGWVETGLIALAVVLLLLAVATFGAPALIGR